MAICDLKSADLRKHIEQVKEILEHLVGNAARRTALKKELLKLTEKRNRNEAKRADLKKEYDRLIESTE